MEIANIEILNYTYGKAYVLDNVVYDIHFPLNWAIHPEKTPEGIIYGPSYCQNCFKYGSFKGVFIGYCVTCAAVYNYERGNGFIYCGEEIGSNEYPETSAWNTYLKDVNRYQIGMNCDCSQCCESEYSVPPPQAQEDEEEEDLCLSFQALSLNDKEVQEEQPQVQEEEEEEEDEEDEEDEDL